LPDLDALDVEALKAMVLVQHSQLLVVAIGTNLAVRPSRGSVRAELPHTALA
jgi:hypothetical protein